MSGEGLLAGRMRRLLALLRFARPGWTRTRLSGCWPGRLAADAPPGYGPVAELLAASAPPSPDELAGEQRVVAQLQDIGHADPPGPTEELITDAGSATLRLAGSVGRSPSSARRLRAR